MSHLMQCAQDAIAILEANKKRCEEFEKFRERVERAIEARHRVARIEKEVTQ
jgi:hypothetical protein